MKKILLIMFTFMCLTLSAYASDYDTTCGFGHNHDYVTFIKNVAPATGETVHRKYYHNRSFSYNYGNTGKVIVENSCIFTKEGSNDWTESMLANSSIYLGKDYMQDVSYMTNDEGFSNILQRFGFERVIFGPNFGELPNPPLIAPSVGASLSARAVLAVILPLIPTILAFLVLLWGFYKAWRMLLNQLRQV